ncbi:hypothetical protein J7L48_11730 [bacterium]|nr:hypothetical protein [bacterium]
MMKIGDILKKYELIDEEKLQTALDYQKENPARLGEIFIKLKIITEDDLFWALSNQFDLPYINLKADMVDVSLMNMFPEQLIKEAHFLPLIKFFNELTVAMTDPTDGELIEKIKNISNCSVNISLCSYKDMDLIKEKVLAIWEGREVNLADSLRLFFEPIHESLINKLMADTSMTSLIIFLFDEMIKSNINSLVIIKTLTKLNFYFNYRGLKNLKFSTSPQYWALLIEKFEELQRLSDTGKIMIKRDKDYSFTYEKISENTITLSKIFEVHRIDNFENLGLNKEQKVILDNILPFRRGLCVFSSPDKNFSRKLAYNIMNFTNARNTIIAKLDGNVILEGFENVIELKDIDSLKRLDDYDVLVTTTDEMSMNDITHIVEEGKLVMLISHTSLSGNFIDYFYESAGDFRRILPHLKLLVTSIVVPTLCPECKKEVEFPYIPKDLFNFYRDVKFYISDGCEKCNYSGYNGFKELNELIFIDKNMRKMLTEKLPAEDLFDSLKSSKFIGLQEKLLELAKEGEIPYYFLF